MRLPHNPLGKRPLLARVALLLHPPLRDLRDSIPEERGGDHGIRAVLSQLHQAGVVFHQPLRPRGAGSILEVHLGREDSGESDVPALQQ